MMKNGNQNNTKGKSSIETRQLGFYPVNTLEGKRNFKQMYRIERDGSIVERVFLDISDVRHREKLICLHYLRHVTLLFSRKEIGLNFLSRDNPWDFHVELSTGERFNVEIVSIADNEQHFEVNKSEERLSKWYNSETIPLHELEKLLKLFPDKKQASIAASLRQRGVGASACVPNPFNSEQGRILISTLMPPVSDLGELIKNAVIKKAEKRHSGKEETVLIVDNRTSAFDIPEYFEAAKTLRSLVTGLPFPEIWFYTGYCSDDDGNNAEYSFGPIKIPESQVEALKKLVSTKGTDEHGRMLF